MIQSLQSSLHLKTGAVEQDKVGNCYCFLVSNTILILLSKISFWEGVSASQGGQAPKFLQHHTLPPQHSCYEVVGQSPETP